MELFFSWFLKFDIGDGSKAKFWYDSWGGDCPLKDEFPKLFGITRIRNASVADLLGLSDGVVFWDLSLLDQFKIGSWNIYQSSWICCTQFE